MDIQRILTPERTKCHATSSTKKSILELTSNMLAEQSDSLHATDILTKLVERERLGSTGIGHGVAIPHARIGVIEAPMASLIQLDTPVDFDSADDQPVNLVFGFIVPEDQADEHLDLISTLATLFNESEFRTRLRKADSDQSLYQAMINYQQETSHAK